MDRRSPKLLLLAWALLAVTVTSPCPAFAWGDEGHKVIALVAEHYLDPTVRAKVAALLAADTDTLTGHDIANETEPQRERWSSGASADWAMEAFVLARRDAYGFLPAPGGQGTYALSSAYTEQAVQDVALQLIRAGVRLAMVLNRALAASQN